MNVLIIEDEPAAAENLKYILNEIEPSITIETVIDTVVDAIDFFNSPHHIELAFLIFIWLMVFRSKYLKKLK